MSTLADGPLIIAVQLLRQMIADCYWWRRIADPDTPWDDATALAHTHIDALPMPVSADGAPDVYSRAEMEAFRPLAFVSLADDAIEMKFPTTSGSCTILSGHLLVSFQIPVPEDISNDASALGEWILKTFGKLIWTGDPTKPGLVDLHGPSRLLFNRMPVGTYYRIPEEDHEDLGDYFDCELDVYWGPN